MRLPKTPGTFMASLTRKSEGGREGGRERKKEGGNEEGMHLPSKAPTGHAAAEHARYLHGFADEEI